MTNSFKSIKISRVVEVLLHRVETKLSIVIHQIANNSNEQRSFYRLLHNDRMSISDLKFHIYQDCHRQVESDKHYLVIQDTTQPNFECNRSNISNTAGLGAIGDGKSLGFFLHPSLVLEADSGRCLGFSDIQHWSRTLGSAVETGRKYGTLPIESKESMRWLQSSEQSAIVLDNALMVTSIADREGDITELFDRRGAEHLLIRSRDDRRIKLPDGSNGKLYQYLSGVPSSGEYTFCMKADKRKSRQKRDVSVDLKFSKVTLFPHKLKGKEIELYAVEAIERNAVAGQKPVLWRILTTHVVDNVSQARQIIDWYAMRWNIEQIFRLIKNKGLAIEDSTLETGKALILMTIMALFAASKILVLHTASKEKDPQPIKKTFSRQEVLCLKALCVQYEGKTDKQRNNHPPDSLQWCYWVIARIGGWKTQEKQAGVITLFRGWNQFQKIYHGWTIAQTFVS